MDEAKLKPELVMSLYNARATTEELDLLQGHAQQPNAAPLAPPDNFLYQLAQISHFGLRLECWLFKATFDEKLFDINDKLETMGRSCSLLKCSPMVRELLSLVLGLGNYMNGGTARGQADGFSLEILPRLEDVKSQDNSTNLLQYVVRLLCRSYSQQAEKPKCPFVESQDFQLACDIKFEQLEAEVERLRKEQGLCQEIVVRLLCVIVVCDCCV